MHDLVAIWRSVNNQASFSLRNAIIINWVLIEMFCLSATSVRTDKRINEYNCFIHYCASGWDWITNSWPNNCDLIRLPIKLQSFQYATILPAPGPSMYNLRICKSSFIFIAQMKVLRHGIVELNADKEHVWKILHDGLYGIDHMVGQ